MFLHPQLQKVASEILYRLSKKNQVIFSTHAPNLIFNFNSRQIRQVILDGNHRPAIREKTDLSDILDDKTTPRLIQFHTLKNAVNPPFLGGFSIFNTVVA